VRWDRPAARLLYDEELGTSIMKPNGGADGKRRLRRQIAAMPVRRTSLGEIEVLLLTSRGSRRWLIPKGWPIRKISLGASAAREAYEEAGVHGEIRPERPIGTYRYVKSMPSGSLDIGVDVFVLHVERQAEEWPEQAERETQWFSPEQAAELVGEPELAAILRSARDFATRAS
jgi:8-oxo-dGTP pyrophosphatase MutT (NUDIX family)